MIQNQITLWFLCTISNHLLKSWKVNNIEVPLGKTTTRSGKIFNKFFLRLDLKPLRWEERIVLFVGYLIQEGKQSSTIRCYLSAIRSVLKTEGIKINEDIYLLNALTHACKLKNDVISTKLPIKRSMINELMKALGKMFATQPYLLCLYRALFITTYFGLFCIGEVTQSPHAVKAKDVLIATNKGKLMFILWSSKTHTKGDKPQIIKISSQKSAEARNGDYNLNSKWCPYDCMQKFLTARPTWLNDHEQFFIFRDHTPVTPEQYRDVLKKCLLQAGFDPEAYSVHRMRGGRALDLLNLGVSVETIKKIGRWKSNTVFTYLWQWWIKLYEKLNSVLLIAAKLTAVQDAWFIGDEFLRSMYHAFTTMTTKAKLMKKKVPYMFSYYNVTSHVMGKGNSNRIAALRILNCVYSTDA